MGFGASHRRSLLRSGERDSSAPARPVVESLEARVHLSARVSSATSWPLNPQWLTNLGAATIFTAGGSPSDLELWRTDGSPSGTAELHRFAAADAHLRDVVRVGDAAYFVYFEDGNSELWKTDGTKIGTTRLAHLDGQSIGRALGVGGQVIFFVPGASADSTALWRTDGTPAGTQKVGDVNGRVTRAWSAADSVLFEVSTVRQYVRDFGLYGYVTDFTLWRTDGTMSGTAEVAGVGSLDGIGASPLQAGDSIGATENLIPLGGTWLFPGAAGGYVRTDGTSAGTTTLQKSLPLPADKSIDVIGSSGSVLYLQVLDRKGTGPAQLWQTDGTAAGTRLVTTFGSGYISAAAPIAGRLLIAWGDLLGHAAVYSLELASSQQSRPSIIRRFKRIVGSFTLFQRKLYFAADDGVLGNELWRSDGTRDGTTLVANIRRGKFSSNPARLTSAQGRLLFTSDDAVHGNVLWQLNPHQRRPQIVTGRVPRILHLTGNDDDDSFVLSVQKDLLRIHWTNPRNFSWPGSSDIVQTFNARAIDGITIDTLAGNDLIILKRGVVAATINGGDGSDTVLGADGDDVILNVELVVGSGARST